MSELFHESPNIVRILIEGSDKKIERFVAGWSLADLVYRIETAITGQASPDKPRKERKKRTLSKINKPLEAALAEGDPVVSDARRPRWGESKLGDPDSKQEQEKAPF